MHLVTVAATLSILSIFGWTAAVNVEGGERVGGCPSPSDVATTTQGVTVECHVDTDCTGNLVQKCCPDQNGVKTCVDPIPACRDGKKINPEDILEGTCDEQAHFMCIDRGCEDGPSGPGGWIAACCGGYAYEWIPGVPEPSCSNGSPLRDSEDELYWCGTDSVRSCPDNSACVTDENGYQICCPASQVCAPGEYQGRDGDPCTLCECGSDGQLTDLCMVVDCVPASCPAGQTVRNKPDECCEYDCVQDCSFIACPAGFPSCGAGYELQVTSPPDACCPQYQCVQIPVCEPGEYHSEVGSPCNICECGADGQPTDNCMIGDCGRVACPPGQTVKYKPGTCCDYDCVDQAVCEPGEMYSEEGSPCNMCECGPDGQPTDNCIVVDCANPECPHGQNPIYRRDECCGYDCIDESCADMDVACPAGFPVCDSGFKLETTYPPGHCCPKHQCVQTNCSNVPCSTPMCAAGYVTQRTERLGMCCPLVDCVSAYGLSLWFRDGKLTTVSYVAIALAAIIAIGVVVTVVACCVFKKKHSAATGPEKQQYNNLTHVDAGGMGKVPLSDGDYFKANKEKEAFGNV